MGLTPFASAGNFRRLICRELTATYEFAEIAWFVHTTSSRLRQIHPCPNERYAFQHEPSRSNQYENQAISPYVLTDAGGAAIEASRRQ